MKSFEQHLDTINQSIQTLNFSRQPVELYEPITYTLSLGGKRLRPALMLMSCELFGGKSDDALMSAVGLEVFHNFTLLHDDIMDKADIRRGKPTVHVKWNDNVAILSGDTMFALAYQYMAQTPADKLPEVLNCFTQTAIEVCEGQQYDMNFETRDVVSIDEYMEMIRLKTSVLLAAALKIGAQIAGAKKEVQELIYQFGENMGLAFQLMDDWLDIYSDVAKFGKATGGDILCNKKTFIYLKTLETASEADKAQLQHYFSSTNFDPQEKINAVKAIYERADVSRHTQELIDQYNQKALNALDAIQLSNEDKQPLRDLLALMTKRES